MLLSEQQPIGEGIDLSFSLDCAEDERSNPAVPEYKQHSAQQTLENHNSWNREHDSLRPITGKWVWVWHYSVDTEVHCAFDAVPEQPVSELLQQLDQLPGQHQHH